MSDNAHYQATEDAHTGPIKNPKQLLATVFFAFIAPILIITGLVFYVVSGAKPSGVAGDDMALYGVSKEARDQEIAERLRKVGSIEIRDANRPLATGEAVFKAQCAACHGSPGIPGRAALRQCRRMGPAHWRRATPRCWSTRSRARARCRHRAAATSKTPRSAAPWSTWPTRAVPSSPSRSARRPPPRRPRAAAVRLQPAWPAPPPRRRCRAPAERRLPPARARQRTAAAPAAAASK